MKAELDKIMSEAMDLSTPLRAFLAAKLIESLLSGDTILNARSK